MLPPVLQQVLPGCCLSDLRVVFGVGHSGGSFPTPRTTRCQRVSGTGANTHALANTLCVICRGSAEIKHFKEANVKPRKPQTSSALLMTRWMAVFYLGR